MNEMTQDQQIGNPAEGMQAPQAQENLLPQHQVNALVGSAKQKGYEKGYREALNSVQPPQQQTSNGVDPDTARKIAEETFAKQQQELQQKMIAAQQTHQAEQTLQQLGAKVNEAKTRLPDFDQVVDFKQFIPAPEVLHYANGVDNSADVIYDLAKNPGKLAQIVALHRTGMRDMANMAVRQLSDSIKQNQNAAQQVKTPEPLNQMKPSNIGLGNGSGKESVSDLRGNPRYRG